MRRLSQKEVANMVAARAVAARETPLTAAAYVSAGAENLAKSTAIAAKSYLAGAAVATPEGIYQPVVTEYLRSLKSMSTELAAVTGGLLPPLSSVFIKRSAVY